MDWQRVKQNDQNGSTSTEDCQGFVVCHEVQVSSLKTLYSWGCVLKCTLKLKYIISQFLSHTQHFATLAHLGGCFLHIFLSSPKSGGRIFPIQVFLKITETLQMVHVW